MLPGPVACAIYRGGWSSQRVCEPHHCGCLLWQLLFMNFGAGFEVLGDFWEERGQADRNYVWTGLHIPADEVMNIWNRPWLRRSWGWNINHGENNPGGAHASMLALCTCVVMEFPKRALNKTALWKNKTALSAVTKEAAPAPLSITVL